MLQLLDVKEEQKTDQEFDYVVASHEILLRLHFIPPDFFKL